jgi:starvation-inducible DNA-binding protein
MEKKRISAISTDLGDDAVVEISGELRKLLADVFALYVKTKNFHWHMSGPHFRDYHLLLDEHGTQIFAMTDDIAERARKIGGTTVRSVSDISKHQRLKDNNAERVAPEDMLAELRADNPGADAKPTFRARVVRKAQRCRYNQSDRELDRRHRAPDLVPF